MEGNDNSQIDLNCNSYNGSNDFDWQISSTNMRDQGACITGLPVSGQLNRFGTCSVMDDSQIQSLSNFAYNSVSNHVPNCASSILNIQDCQTSIGFELRCVSLDFDCIGCTDGPISGITEIVNSSANPEKKLPHVIRALADVDQYKTEQFLVTVNNQYLKTGISNAINSRDFVSARNYHFQMLYLNGFSSDLIEFYDIIISLGENTGSAFNWDGLGISNQLKITNWKSGNEEVNSLAQSYFNRGF